MGKNDECEGFVLRLLVVFLFLGIYTFFLYLLKVCDYPGFERNLVK